MKYKVGDKVRVKRDLEERKPAPGHIRINPTMVKMAGKLMTIAFIDNIRIPTYRTNDNPWNWTDDMLEPMDSGKFPHIDEITKSLGLKEGDKILVNGAEYIVGVLGLINDKGDYANLKSILGQSFKIIPKPKTGAEILAHLKELRGEWEPNWEDAHEEKYHVRYHHSDEGWVSYVSWGVEIPGASLFSEETAKKAVEYLNTLTKEESMNLLKEMRI